MKIMFLALCVTSAAPALSQRPLQKLVKPEPTEISGTEPGGRYQVIPAIVNDVGSTTEHTVFLLDTVSGDVWKYVPSITYTEKDGSKKYTPPLFEKVERTVSR